MSSRRDPYVTDLGFQFRDTARNPHDATFCTHPKLDRVYGVNEQIKVALKRMVGEKLVLNHKNCEFLPLDDFDRIFCPHSIKALVEEEFSEKYNTEPMQTDLINKIQDRRRILAILLLMDSLQYLESFISQCISDEALPLEYGDPTNSSNWGDHDRYLFHLYQYFFHVPYFAIQRPPHIYRLPEETVLPWLTLDSIQKRDERPVYKVLIHREHHNVPTCDDSGGNTRQSYFALKKVHENTSDNELEALQKVSCKSYKTTHLVSLLLAFVRGRDTYFLFELADGNLREFWEKFDANSTQSRPVSMNQKWATRQCLGLATAVKLIHGEATMDKQRRKLLAMSGIDIAQSPDSDYGRHNDIKPKNILWFANREGMENHLVVTDLGSTCYHPQRTRSNDLPRGGGTDRYEAPEAKTIKRLSRMCDIWSLGCVFLEFCIWWLEGYKYVRLFEGECAYSKQEWENLYRDNFYWLSRSEKEAEVKPVVHKKIKELQRDFPDDLFCQALLALVRDSMIVVNPVSRHSIGMICTELQKIVSEFA